MDAPKLPSGRIVRLARFARLAARTGASALVSKDGAAAADDAAEVLGAMRGLAAKIGQMASFVDGMVPEAHQAAYEKALRALRDAAPRSAPEAVRRVVEEELGAPIDALFAEWSDEPFASASIGQVHAARLSDGREVAVKVQHPGVARAVESDLANASMFEGVLRAFAPRALETKAVLDVIRARFREELDYRLEAERQIAFGRMHAGDPAIRIPAVVAERSSARVLTTELVRGRTLEEVARDDDEDTRRSYAETLWRFVFKGNLVHRMFNADPHPGNYVFSPEGAPRTVTFLDFGCVQDIADEPHRFAHAAHVAAIGRDRRAFDDAMRGMLRLRGGRYEAFVLDFTRELFEPLFASPYRIERRWVGDIFEHVRDAKVDLLRKEAGFVAPPAAMTFMNRLQFGFYSVLARLDVAVDYAAVERAFLLASTS